MDDIRHEASELSLEHDRWWEALLADYGEVCEKFRMLTDIRFKLLAFLPIARAVAVALGNGTATVPSLGLSLFGLVKTGGLVTYNTRNDRPHNRLADRATTI